MATFRRSILWRLAADPVCRLWSGAGWLDMPGDDLDPGGARYFGAGALLQVPALKTLMNGLADRQSFGLSGVSAETIRLALEDRETVEGASLHVGYVDFDREWQVDGGAVWTWEGVADVLSIESKGDDGGRQRTISLSVASADVLRAVPQLAWFTHADQQRRSPGDNFFDRVAQLSAGATRRFGPR